MAQSTATIDYGKVFQGTATANGTFTADYPIPTDKGARLVAVAIISAASGGHMNAFGSLRAEYVVENQNGVLSAPTAVSSTNPLNSTVAGEATAHVQASDATFSGGAGSPIGLAWSISGTNARATFQNNSGTGVTANVTIVIDAIIVGST